MRIINVLRNSMYSIFSYVLIAVLGIVVRKFFVQYLQIELLGLEGLFSNIVSLLSLAEMGIATVISYGLYREFANHNKAEINILMNIYRYIYTIIGIVIFIVSLILFFFLPFIIRENTVSWFYIQVVYVIQIGAVLSSYFLAYKRTLFAADQKDYICIKIDIICSLMSNIFKLIAIIVFQNYLMYAVTSLFFNILANLIISHKVEKSYSFLHSVKVTLQDLRDRKFFKDVKNFLVHKISYIVYSGTDAIVISILLGLRMSGLFSNYVLINTGIYSLLYKALQGIIPSIGNLVYTDDLEKSYRIYRMLDLLYFFIGGYVCCIYALLLQPFMTMFFGGEFLLPDEYVIGLAINIFLGMQFENAYNFRSTHGNFENDRKYMIMSAIVKLFLSVVLVKYLGVVGVIIGTIGGLLFIIYGRIQFVFRIILKKSIAKYLMHHLCWSLIMFGEILVIKYIIEWLNFAISYSGLLLQCLIIAILMAIFQITVFYRTEEFKDILGYIENIKAMLKKKFG